jgi:DNA-binding SARP family transcriptional activator/tetratricopeptide (TPR) repeat protein
MARLSLTLLGGFRARLDSDAPLALPTRKAQALLAYLAMPPGVAHPRDKLASLLWGSTVETTARTSLRQTLYALRKAMHGADPPPLRMDANTVALDPRAVTVDVVAFRQGMGGATTSRLADVLSLYQGDLLEGLTIQEPPFEDWLLGERERLREQALEGFGRLLAHQQKTGASEGAVQTALRLLALDPLQEPVHRALMRLFAETGRRGAALRQYQLCVAAFQRELRAEPEAETKALYQDILRRRAHGRASPEGRPVADARPAGLGPPRSAALEPAGVAEPPLVGRDRDLARLREGLHDAIGGRGRLVVLIGEVGIGKSRLVSELAAVATGLGGRVMVGRCYETERILPFAPWVDALRTGHVLEERELFDSLEPGWRGELGRLLPELPGAAPMPASAPIGRGGNARHLFEAIGELLARLARRRPLVVVLEDLHWADEMSVRLLAFLGRRLHAVPLLVLGTVREEELADSALLRQTLDELDTSGQLQRMPVAPLSRADIIALVRVLASPGLPDSMALALADEAWRASDGNAFVVVEVMHALRDGTMVAGAPGQPLPTRVRNLVRQRLERLSERGRRLVAAAAVIGRQFDFRLLQRTADLSEREAAEGVEELVRHRVLRGSGEGLEFSHDRIREVAAEELAPPLRAAIHRRIAESLEEISGSDLAAHALALGTHYRLGRVWNQAVTHLHAAGRQAAARSAHHQALVCFEESLNALRQLPVSREVMGRDLDLRIDLRQSLFPLGRLAELRDHLREAERLAEALDDRRRLAQVSTFVSNHARITGDLPQALASGRRALALAEALADHRLTVEANLRLGQVHWSLGRYRDAVTFLETAAEPDGTSVPADPRGGPAELGLADFGLYWLGPVLAELGRFEEALAAAGRAVKFATQTERPFPLAGALASIGLVYLYQGRLDDAATAATRGLEICQRWEVPVHRPWLAAMLGYAYALSGRVSEGLALLHEAVDEAEKSGVIAAQAWRLAWLSEASLLGGRPVDAAKWADRALEQARQLGERGHEAWALRAQAEVASNRKPPARKAARQRYDEAIALAQSLGMRPLKALCQVELAAIHRAAGRRDQARALLNSARQSLQSMGMDFWLTRARVPGSARKRPSRRA